MIATRKAAGNRVFTRTRPGNKETRRLDFQTLRKPGAGRRPIEVLKEESSSGHTVA